MSPLSRCHSTHTKNYEPKGFHTKFYILGFCAYDEMTEGAYERDLEAYVMQTESENLEGIRKN